MLTTVSTCRHVANTKEIINFAIVGEAAAAKGVRRIVAVTDVEALAALRTADEFSVRLDSFVGLECREQESALKACLTVSTTYSFSEMMPAEALELSLSVEGA